MNTKHDYPSRRKIIAMEPIYEEIDSFGERAKTDFGMRGTPLEDIPNEYLFVAFLSREDAARLSRRARLHLLETTGHTDYEVFEFYGDAILELVMVEELYRSPEITSPAEYRKLRPLALTNRAFACLLSQQGYCAVDPLDELVSRRTIKDCGDRFEGLVGAVYSYLLTVPELSSRAFAILSEWIRREWNIPDFLLTLRDGNLRCGLEELF